MYQIGAPRQSNLKQIFSPLIILTFLLSLLLLLIWTVVLPYINDDTEDLHNRIGTALWCIWSLMVTVAFTLTFLTSELMKTEPQTHFVMLVCWSSVFNIYSTLLLQMENKSININSMIFYQLEKTFFAITNFSLATMFACRVFVDFLVSTSMTLRRIAVTSATVVIASATFGFFVYSRESITILVIFIAPTFVSICMIVSRKFTDNSTNECSEDRNDEISQSSLIIAFVLITILTIPYVFTSFLTINKTLNACFIRLSFWKSLTTPILLLTANKTLRNRFIAMVTSKAKTKTKTLVACDTSKNPPKRRAFSDPPPRSRRYGSMRSSSVTIVAPIIEEEEEVRPISPISKLENLTGEMPKNMNSIVELDDEFCEA